MFLPTCCSKAHTGISVVASVFGRNLFHSFKGTAEDSRRNAARRVSEQKAFQSSHAKQLTFPVDGKNSRHSGFAQFENFQIIYVWREKSTALHDTIRK